MKQHGPLFLGGAGLLLILLALNACAQPTPAPTSPPSPLPTGAAGPEAGAAARAVELIAAWVDAGAPETATFDYTGVDGAGYRATFEVDILRCSTPPAPGLRIRPRPSPATSPTRRIRRTRWT